MGLNATLLGAQLAGAMAQNPMSDQGTQGIPYVPSQAPQPYNFVQQPAPQGPGPWAPSDTGPYAPKLDAATIGTSEPPQQTPVLPAVPKKSDVGPFIGADKSNQNAKSDQVFNQVSDLYSGVAPEAPSITSDLKQPTPDTNQSRLDTLLNSAPKEDPRIQVARDAATALLSKLDPNSETFLAPPKYPGMSIGQALVGIAGALATQSNPHAQFVAQYIQSLGNAVQQQYGNTLQGWQVAREAIKDQAQNLLGQASSLQNYQAEIYKANIGPYGRGLVADMNNQGKLNVAQIQQAGLLQRNLQTNNSRETVQALRDFNNASSSPEQRKLAWAAVVKSDPRYEQIDPQVVQAGLDTPSGKFLLEKAQAQNQGALSTLNTAKAATETALLQPRIDDYKAKFDLQEGGAFAALQKGFNLDAEAKKTIEQTKEMPEQLANQTITAKATAQRSQAYADNIANTAQYQKGLLQIGNDKLTLQQAADLANAGKASAQSLANQATAVRAQGQKMIQGAAALGDTEAQADQIAQGNRLLGTANSLQQQAKATFDSASKALSKVQFYNDKGNPSPAQTLAPKATGTGSNAVNQANAATPLSFAGISIDRSNQEQVNEYLRAQDAISKGKSPDAVMSLFKQRMKTLQGG